MLCYSYRIFAKFGNVGNSNAMRTCVRASAKTRLIHPIQVCAQKLYNYTI